MTLSIDHYENSLLEYAKAQMLQDPAHDIAHVLRVVRTAKQLAQNEGAQLEVVVPAAYLHDCVSLAKNHPDRAKSSHLAADKAILFLQQLGYPAEYFQDIHHAIVAHSFSAKVIPKTLEAEVVQDADRLDALGAIGVARCIQVGTALGVALYNPQDPFCQQRDPDDRLYSVDHFYTKLFTLKDTMCTDSARREGEKRTEFMRQYLAQLAGEV
ncbi:HD domain-containing protein [Vibrio panuliri]|uniref:Phosphohydrolase n=1 Tax=Vibrio panuliri TaxID=1381081 RepID=A0ABX3F3T2_9VIBR|nr:HD domain-containing protein [Vibrio panuliri]KAB1454035.1 HD domain-containing protein [Vibrio panuliri]OLQ84449.1 phosphohydrolase [Vibrio panuliri]